MSSRPVISIWIILLISISTTFSVKAQTDDNLFLYLPTGAIQIVDLNDLQKITFTEQNINIHFKSPYKDIQAISYDTLISFKEKSTVIETVELGNIHLSMKPPYVLIETDDVIKDVLVYNLKGSQLIKETIDDSSASLSLEALAPGIYIICVYTEYRIHNFKIIK